MSEGRQGVVVGMARNVPLSHEFFATEFVDSLLGVLYTAQQQRGGGGVPRQSLRPLLGL